MYRELRMREAALLDQVRVAALSSLVSPERIFRLFPDLMLDQGAPVVSQILSPEDAIAVAAVDDDFEGETVFTMEPEEAISILNELGQTFTLEDLMREPT